MTQPSYMTIAEKILEVLNANPDGLTKYDIFQKMPGENQTSISTQITTLMTKGCVEIIGTTSIPPELKGQRGRQYYKVYKATGLLYTEAPSKPSQNYISKTMYKNTVAELEKIKQELQELLKWKAKALVRFPDLLVEPEVLEARVKAADILKEKNRHAEAEDVLAGKLDHIPLMKSMISLVESLGEMNL